jgi:hypothetical protein
VLGGGAEWIWNPAAEFFPGAMEIVDLLHAREHQKRWTKIHQRRLLDKGKIEQLVAALRSIQPANAGLAEKLRTAAGHFDRNSERMRYPAFRRQHLSAGAGGMEGVCKAAIASRWKQSGMFGTVRGANATLALRCCLLNGRF